MKLNNFLKFTMWRIQALNKNAQNPFIKKEYPYNPFEPMFKRTYVWIEEQNQNKSF